MTRTWNTPVREPWNPSIHYLLKAIDQHNACYFLDQNPWHLEKAELLRTYLLELKTWIHSQESKLVQEEECKRDDSSLANDALRS
jgi:hypothetical protein